VRTHEHRHATVMRPTATNGIDQRMLPGWLALSLGLLLSVCLLASCGSGDGGAPASPPPAEPSPSLEPGAEADCSDFLSWREAQDALESDSSLEDYLDDDLDSIACNELAQTEYEDAWASAYPEACEAVFVDSPDGFLYLDDVAYEQSECDGTDPGPSEWEGDSFSEPEEDGSRDAWLVACDEFFNGYVGGDLFWGDDIVVSSADCELASPY
jgi:hypothetical protein